MTQYMFILGDLLSKELKFTPWIVYFVFVSHLKKDTNNLGGCS
jgi:hypothetical protein